MDFGVVIHDLQILDQSQFLKAVIGVTLLLV